MRSACWLKDTVRSCADSTLAYSGSKWDSWRSCCDSVKRCAAEGNWRRNESVYVLSFGMVGWSLSFFSGECYCLLIWRIFFIWSGRLMTSAVAIHKSLALEIVSAARTTTEMLHLYFTACFGRLVKCIGLIPPNFFWCLTSRSDLASWCDNLLVVRDPLQQRLQHSFYVEICCSVQEHFRKPIW